MVAKIVCKNCGELPFVILNIPQNIEADEIPKPIVCPSGFGRAIWKQW